MIRLFTATWCTVTYKVKHTYPTMNDPILGRVTGGTFEHTEHAHGKCGLLLNWHAAWVGWHIGHQGQRICINVVPFVTFWITLPGGPEP